VHPHFEGIQLQDERRQRQLQITKFFGSGLVAVFHDELCLRLETGVVDGGRALVPRRPEPAGLPRNV
jgi:hypothetical protein